MAADVGKATASANNQRVPDLVPMHERLRAWSEAEPVTYRQPQTVEQPLVEAFHLV